MKTVAVTNLIPKLYSFITFRPERFGALVYNPYLGIEKELDHQSAYCASLCNGNNSLAQIETEMQRRFNLKPNRTGEYITSVLDELGQMSALSIKQGSESSPPLLPDTPVFAEDGPYLSAPKNVVWDVTYFCNLSCKHCLTASGTPAKNELNTSEALALIDKLAAAGVLSVSLSGGEPFLRKDILTLVEHITKANMRVDIATNGISLPETTLKRLSQLPVFQMQVSIDGIAEQHDKLRGRAGAFERSCKTIRKLRKQGIQVGIGMTVTADNFNSVERVIDLALELDCSAFKAIPFLPAGRGHENQRLGLSRENYRQLGKIITTRSKELEGSLNITTVTTFPFLFANAPDKVMDNGPMGCAAGYDTLSIGADGSAYPCTFLQEFPLGNLRDQNLQTLWATAPTLKQLRKIQKQDLSDPCGSCNYAPLECRGGCRAAAFLQSGNLLAADPTCFKCTTTH